MNTHTPILPPHFQPDLALIGTLLAYTSTPPDWLLARDLAAFQSTEHLALYRLSSGGYAISRQRRGDLYPQDPQSVTYTVQVVETEGQLEGALGESPPARALLYLAGLRRPQGETLDLVADDVTCYQWAAVAHGQKLPFRGAPWSRQRAVQAQQRWNNLMGDLSPDDVPSTREVRGHIVRDRQHLAVVPSDEFDRNPEEWQAWLDHSEAHRELDNVESDCLRIWQQWHEDKALERIETAHAGEVEEVKGG